MNGDEVKVNGQNGDCIVIRLIQWSFPLMMMMLVGFGCFRIGGEIKMAIWRKEKIMVFVGHVYENGNG